MTKDTAPADGATESSRIEYEQHSQDAETAASGEPTREELAAKNEHLRERVTDLETALADVQAALAENSVETGDSSKPSSGTVDAAAEATAGDRPELVTSGGQPTKVIGRLDDDQGIGVLGEATASSTLTYGVEGITQSSDNDAAGVRASAPNGARGLVAEADGNRGIEVSVTGDDAIYAETDDLAAIFGINTAASGRAWGVRGDTASTDENAFGVRGEALDGSGATKGVAGITNGEGDGAAGVYGEARSSSGVAHGVKGETNSSDGYGLYTPDDANVAGSMSVGNGADVAGSMSVGKVGVAAYLDGNQTIDHSTLTRVEFNNTVVDHFRGMNTSTGVYTVLEAGHYHISFMINWIDDFGSGIPISHRLYINGRTFGQGINSVQKTVNNSRKVKRNFSRTVFDLDFGDTVWVSVNQESGSSKEIYGLNQETYITIHKVG